jgi:hypothetical protein
MAADDLSKVLAATSLLVSPEVSIVSDSSAPAATQGLSAIWYKTRHDGISQNKLPFPRQNRGQNYLLSY